jgi:hypothetical protein
MQPVVPVTLDDHAFDVLARLHVDRRVAARRVDRLLDRVVATAVFADGQRPGGGPLGLRDGRAAHGREGGRDRDSTTATNETGSHVLLLHGQAFAWRSTNPCPLMRVGDRSKTDASALPGRTGRLGA